MASIVGTVTDSSGAVIPNARITVTEVQKHISYRTSSNSLGQYVATALPIGNYQVRAERDGFKTAVAGPFSLNVQQRLDVSFKLQVGTVTQTVSVKGISPQLETQTSSLGQVIGSRQMETLPLNGRNFAQLALLSVGVVPADPGARNIATYGFSSDGGRAYQNNFMLDGVDNNSNLGDLFNNTSYVVQSPLDSLQEFKVQTNDYSAEFSRGNGAVVNAVTKSGTNQLHGEVYEFLRNDVLDSRNFFSTSRPIYKHNQFGFTLGGPIVVPKIYNGKDKTFFFVDYEGLRLRQGQTKTGTVPTLAERNGDFQSQIDYTSPVMNGSQPVLDCNGVATYQGELFDTRLTQASSASPTGLCGVPFAYNTSGQPINQMGSALNPVSAKLANLWGVPNISGAGYNFISQPEMSTDRNNFDVRLDQHFSDKDTAFVRYSYENEPSIIPTIFQASGGYGTDFSAGIQNFFYQGVALSETHIFNHGLLNEFRFGYNRINAHRYPWGYQQDLTAQIGIPGVPYGPGNGGYPEFDFSNYTGFGDHSDLPTVEKQNTFEFSDTLTWLHGGHTFKFGTDLMPVEFTIQQPGAARGDWEFNNQFTDNPAAPGTGGSDAASFLLGEPYDVYISSLKTIYYVRNILGFFAQDDWRLTPKLTLNLGLRYDYFGNIHEKHNEMGNFDIPTNTMIIPKGSTATLTPILSALIGLSPTGTNSLVPQQTDTFAPRVGLAYRLTNRLVLRSGYGIFYSGYENGPWSNPSPGYNSPFYVQEEWTTPCGAPSANPALGSANCALPLGLDQISNGLPPNSLSNPSSPRLAEWGTGGRNPRMQQWHFTAQYQLPSNTLLEIGYAGSRGDDLYIWFNGNQAAPSDDPSAPTGPRRPDPAIDSGISELSGQGYSNFSALQARLEKRWSNGLSFLTSYQWGHALDNGSSANINSGNNSGLRDFLRYPNLDYGNADFDVRQRWVTSYLYRLPFGHGARWGQNLSGVMDQIVGGWNMSGILSFQSGNWYTVSDGSANFANSDGSQNPDLTGNPNGSPCVPGTLFNTCAFANPALGSLGSSGVNIVQEPGIIAWDMSLLKDFRISEPKRFEFRAEFFNIMNHPNLTTTNLDSSSSSFAFPSSASTPREIQFGLKFYF